MLKKKIIYIAGPMTGVDKYWEAFERAEDDLIALGCIPLSPAKNPAGLTKEQYMRIDFGMIDCADAVLFLPGSDRSEGAKLEYHYCEYIEKPIVYLKERGGIFGDTLPHDVQFAWLKHDLEEVFGE
jgi:nucleoside 2-deoxyribosyltransferase